MISVIICTFNRSQSLTATLTSLKSLTVPSDLLWELLVVDNNSTDDTKTCLLDFQRSAGFTVRYVFEASQGLSHARNAGVRAAAGDIIAFTDDDVTVDPNWLAAIHRAFQQADCMCVGGKIVPVWGLEKPSWYVDKGPYGMMPFIIRFDLGNVRETIDIPPFGANMSFRKVAFEKYGSFRTDLGRSGKGLLHGEDTEFTGRLLRGGEKVCYEPAAVVHHPVEKERTEKAYCQRWYFTYGRTLARRSEIGAGVARLFGVPRFLFRSLLDNWLRWAFSFERSARFYHKLEVFQIAGQIRESYEVSRSSHR